MHSHFHLRGLYKSKLKSFDYLRMDNNIKSHQFPESLICETKLIGIVSTIIERSISCWDVLVISIAVVENDSGNSGDLSAEIKSIFHGWFPILGLVNSSLVSFNELTPRLANHDTSCELSHGVHVLRQGFDQLFLFLRQLTSLEHILFEVVHLRLIRELTCQ